MAWSNATTGHLQHSWPSLCSHQKDWDQHVPLLLMAYRSAVHETTKCTPAKLMLGRDLRLPVGLMYGCPEEKQHTYVETLQDWKAFIPLPDSK